MKINININEKRPVLSFGLGRIQEADEYNPDIRMLDSSRLPGKHALLDISRKYLDLVPENLRESDISPTAVHESLHNLVGYLTYEEAGDMYLTDGHDSGITGFVDMGRTGNPDPEAGNAGTSPFMNRLSELQKPGSRLTKEDLDNFSGEALIAVAPAVKMPFQQNWQGPGGSDKRIIFESISAITKRNKNGLPDNKALESALKATINTVGDLVAGVDLRAVKDAARELSINGSLSAGRFEEIMVSRGVEPQANNLYYTRDFLGTVRKS